MKTFNANLRALAPYGLFVVRLIVGGLFVWHGIDKFQTGMTGVEGFFSDNGVPLPGITAPLTAIAEIVLGAALIIGIITRLSAVLLTGIMLGAMIWVASNGAFPGDYELNLAYIAGLLSLVFFGSGAWSLDDILRLDASDVTGTVDSGRAAVSA